MIPPNLSKVNQPKRQTRSEFKLSDFKAGKGSPDLSAARAMTDSMDRNLEHLKAFDNKPVWDSNPEAGKILYRTESSRSDSDKKLDGKGNWEGRHRETERQLDFNPESGQVSSFRDETSITQGNKTHHRTSSYEVDGKGRQVYKQESSFRGDSQVIIDHNLGTVTLLEQN